MASEDGPAVPLEERSFEVSNMSDIAPQASEDVRAQKASPTPIEMSEMSSTPHQPGSTSRGDPPDASDAGRGVQSKENPESARPPSEYPQGLQVPPREPLATMPPDGNTDSCITSAPSLSRMKSGPAIGPATDKPSLLKKESEVEGPVLYITLLLTTGARHPFRLDRKYLKKRNVEVEGDNPVNMSLYKLKELILRDWREEWEAKPSSPESIRLISMGKLLTDKSRLADFGFKDGAGPTIVHMTIKPQEIVDEEEANKAPRDREGSERSPGCRCMIM